MFSTREWAQHILLKSLCSQVRKNVNTEVISQIRPEYFTSNLYRKGFRLIKEHFEETGEFYTWSEFIQNSQIGETNARKLKATELRRKTLVKTDDSLQLPRTSEAYLTFTKRVQHDARHIKLIELNNDLSAKLNEEMDEESLAPLLDLVRDTVAEIDHLKASKGVLFKVSKDTIREKLKGFYKSLQENFFIPTGFRDFDDVNIGIPLSSLFVMAAPTGCGKSTLCLQYLMNAVRAGAKVCLLPLEMSEEEMLLKMASNLLEIPTNELVKDLKKYYKRMVKALTSFLAESEGVFHFYTPDLEETLPMVLSKLRTNNYDVIAVDYINLLAGMKKEKWEALDEAGIYAKRFAGKYKTQIVFLAQLDKNTGDTRYSKAIMEHACVTADTQILTTDGYQSLSSIIGDKNLKNKQGKFYPVDCLLYVINQYGKKELCTHYYVNGKDKVYELKLENGYKIKCTQNHKFLCEERPNVFNWLSLGQLRIKDVIKTNPLKGIFSTSKIINIKYLGEALTYDLFVENTHSYIANDIVVHNSNMWTWNHTAQDIIENQKIDVNQPKARGQNPKPFSLRANLACSYFGNYIEDMDNYKKSYRKQSAPALSKGFDGNNDVPDL